jgi:hypothetical protein
MTKPKTLRRLFPEILNAEPEEWGSKTVQKRDARIDKQVNADKAAKWALRARVRCCKVRLGHRRGDRIGPTRPRSQSRSTLVWIQPVTAASTSATGRRTAFAQTAFSPVRCLWQTQTFTFSKPRQGPNNRAEAFW